MKKISALQLDPIKIKALLVELKAEMDDKDQDLMHGYAMFWFDIQRHEELPPAPETLSEIIDQLKDEYKVYVLSLIIDCINKTPTRELIGMPKEWARKTVIKILGVDQ